MDERWDIFIAGAAKDVVVIAPPCPDTPIEREGCRMHPTAHERDDLRW